MHTNSETSSLTADPKLRVPTAFRTRAPGHPRCDRRRRLRRHDRQGQGPEDLDDLLAGLCLRPRQHRRVRAVPEALRARRSRWSSEAWPKLFQPDYTEIITKILQAKPQALYSALWGGDLVSFIDQANIYDLFAQTDVFAINMADYTTLTAVKNLPQGIHSATATSRRSRPRRRTRPGPMRTRRSTSDYPTNWSWENATAVTFLAEALKKTNSTDGKKLAEALSGMKHQVAVRRRWHDHDARRGPDARSATPSAGAPRSRKSPTSRRSRPATGSPSSSSRPSGRRGWATPDVTRGGVGRPSPQR